MYAIFISEQNLVKTCFDLFAAGTETTSTAISWALIFFLHWPHVQDKCFKEISDVIGTQRPPRVQDRAQMPYMEATILEVLRKANIVPLSVQHGLASDVKFHDYVIPRDAIVLPDLESALADPEVWGNPDNFLPERFIGPDGKVKRPDDFVVFGLGQSSLFPLSGGVWSGSVIIVPSVWWCLVWVSHYCSLCVSGSVIIVPSVWWCLVWVSHYSSLCVSGSVIIVPSVCLGQSL